MEDLIQKKNEIITKINALNEKLSEITVEESFKDRNQISLILNNLNSSILNCDENLLVKQLLDTIITNIKSIETNINAKAYSVNQSYLYELIRAISYLNNSNGKQNLQGYQQAVKKNISLLEKDIEISLKKLDELKQEIDTKTKEFKLKESDISTALSSSKTEYTNELKNIAAKYDTFITDYIKKQTEFQSKLTENQNNFKTEYNNQIIKLKEDISQTKIDFSETINQSISNFDNERKQSLETLSNQVREMIKKTQEELNILKNSATEQIGFVASATFSNVYKEYSDIARKESKWWYLGTLVSMGILVGLSIWWFVFTRYTSNDYMALIAKIFATVGIAVIARYCAIQASKSKTVETKLRKIQLQMGTFDAFVASLDKEKQGALKIELTQKLINQQDWLDIDKDEIDVIKEFEKIINKFGYSVEINKKDKEG